MHKYLICATYIDQYGCKKEIIKDHTATEPIRTPEDKIGIEDRIAWEDIMKFGLEAYRPNVRIKSFSRYENQ